MKQIRLFILKKNQEINYITDTIYNCEVCNCDLDPFFIYRIGWLSDGTMEEKLYCQGCIKKHVMHPWERFMEAKIVTIGAVNYSCIPYIVGRFDLQNHRSGATVFNAMDKLHGGRDNFSRCKLSFQRLDPQLEYEMQKRIQAREEKIALIESRVDESSSFFDAFVGDVDDSELLRSAEQVEALLLDIASSTPVISYNEKKLLSD